MARYNKTHFIHHNVSVQTTVGSFSGDIKSENYGIYKEEDLSQEHRSTQRRSGN